MPRVYDLRVLGGIFWVLRSGAPWRDMLEQYGTHTTAFNRFNRWREAVVWDRLMDKIAKSYDGKIHMIDFTSIPACQQAALIKRGITTFLLVEVAED